MVERVKISNNSGEKEVGTERNYYYHKVNKLPAFIREFSFKFSFI